jgi:hypothetical protein
MTICETQEEIQDQQAQDQTGSLADSARRHIAYERLARQVAASEAAARLVLEVLARKQKAAGEAAPEEEIHERNDRN